MKKCSLHPKYKAQKKPHYQCEQCLSIYFVLNGKRIPIPPPTKAHKTAKDYERHPKHKKKINITD